MRYDPELNALLNYLHGRENQDDDVGAVARFVASHLAGRPRPAKGSAEAADFVYRWPNIETLKTHARFYGPELFEHQIDLACSLAESAPDQLPTV